MANTFIRTWALMTELQKKARGLEWIVDLIVQLPDNCTVPKYFDGCASLWCGNHGRGAAVSRAAERRQRRRWQGWLAARRRNVAARAAVRAVLGRRRGSVGDGDHSGSVTTQGVCILDVF